MFGLIGKIQATPGDGGRLAEILAGMGEMPGCLSYIAALDGSDSDMVWVTEVWESRDAHAESLQMSAVQAAIAEGRPLIVGFEQRHETLPTGGHGLSES